MTSTCQRVSERVATGEPLGRFEDHIAACRACRELIELPGLIEEASAHRAVEVPAGFAHRAVARAKVQSRAMRARRRLSIAAGLAATAATGVMALVLAGGGAPRQESPTQPAPMQAPASPAPAPTPATPASDHELVRDLVELTDVDHAMAAGADWDRITEPITAASILLDSEDDHEP